jgi:hypothetical protein
MLSSLLSLKRTNRYSVVGSEIEYVLHQHEEDTNQIGIKYVWWETTEKSKGVIHHQFIKRSDK